MAPKRILQLDVLRGFAILLVMGVHVPAYPIWSTAGMFGVDLFFVLSGFLISNLLFAEFKAKGGIGFARFFARRALKLYPSFYLLLALTLVYCRFFNVPVAGRELVGEATLTQNYVGAIWGHTWSLAVEEHFYILLPLLLAFLLKRNGEDAEDPFRAIPWVFAGVALACLGGRLFNAWAHPGFAHGVHFEPSHLRIDTLAFGVLLSYLHNFRPWILQKLMSGDWRFPVSWISVIALAPALFLPAEDPAVHTIGFTLLYIGFGTMLLLSVYPEPSSKRAPPGRAVKAIAWMGGYSYTLYLWHVPMAQLFAALAPRLPMVNPYLLHAAYFAASLAAGVASAKLLELPVLRLRERLFPPACIAAPNAI